MARAVDEFELIDQYFRRRAPSRADVPLGIGDDAAVVTLNPGEHLVAAVDTLVAGKHFPPTFSAAEIGYRALAVNLSDLAAMGAEPRWALLALTLPSVDPDWLDGFGTGLCDLAAAHQVALIGGDTTEGPLTITVTLLGAGDHVLTRAGAKIGDTVFVTGTLGDAALALALDANDDRAGALQIRAHFARPEPRVAVGRALRDIAHAAIDVSDGLLGDLSHVLRASGVGACIDGRLLPISAQAFELFGAERAFEAAATGGDDYELLFTAAPEQEPEIIRRLNRIGCPVTRIGTIESGRDLKLLGLDGARAHFTRGGHRHFAR